jgi:UPF0042 nucleotide-binding protein
MQFVIVTGMSGAGKSTLLNIFEDLGYYCVDNLPPKLIHNLADFCLEGSAGASGGSGIEKVALGIDIRSTKRANELFAGLEALDQRHLPYTILFLEANDDVILNRYKETRRSHPQSKAGSITDGIAEERELLLPIKQRATNIVDTSLLLVRQLREMVVKIYVDRKDFGLIVHVQSFGFKHGHPAIADLVFDVRCLPNPFYVQELKAQTGLDEPVREFVMKSEVSQKLLKDLTDMMIFLIPHYIKEGKNHLVIAVGCTGGKHRSVTMARGLHDALQDAGHSVVINHRDITKA